MPRPRTRRHSAPDVLHRAATSDVAQPRRLSTTVDVESKMTVPLHLPSDRRRGSSLVDHRGCRLHLIDKVVMVPKSNLLNK